MNKSARPTDMLISTLFIPAGSARVRHSSLPSSYLTSLPVLFSLAGTVISPKFFRKIEYLDTLSQLASAVPIMQVQIPAAVYTCVAPVPFSWWCSEEF